MKAVRSGLVGMEHGAAAVGDSSVVLQKPNTEFPRDSAISLLGAYPKELKSGTQIGSWMSVFTAALFTIAKRWKQFKCLSTDD